MKKSINQWSFSGMDLFDCIALAGRAGFEAFEPAFHETGPVSPASTRQDMEKVRAAIEKAGMSVASLAGGVFWGYNLASNNPDTRKKGEELAASALQCAAWMGADALLVVPGVVCQGFGTPPEVVSYDACWDRALAAAKRLAPIAEKHKVKIGMENVWNSFLLSPLEMKTFIDTIGSEYVGVYFDVGNVIPFGFSEQWIRILGKRIVKIHIKDFRKSVGTISGFVDLLTGDVNWPEVMKALREIGYDGPLTAEMSGYAHDREGNVWQTSNALSRIMKMG